MSVVTFAIQYAAEVMIEVWYEYSAWIVGVETDIYFLL